MDLELPYNVEDINEKTTEEINSYTIIQSRYVSVGPSSYVYPEAYKILGPQFYYMSVRPDDIFLVGHPRTGTTWTQEMIWLLNNNLDYEMAKSADLNDRFPLLDLCLTMTPETEMERLEKVQDIERKEFLKKSLEPAVSKLARTPSPRFIKSHLPFSLLPPDLLDTAKAVYIARDPRDVAVSFYNICKYRFLKAHIAFDTFWSLFKRGLLSWSPIFPHLKEAWQLRSHPNMLFLLYEDLSKDLPGTLKRMADFFGKTYTEDQIQTLCEHLQFEKFKANDAVNQSKVMQELGVVDCKNPFIREGKVGGWRNYFQGDLEADAEKWMTENLADTDFKFPTFNSKD